jgi:hypothetical protein
MTHRAGVAGTPTGLLSPGSSQPDGATATASGMVRLAQKQTFEPVAGMSALGQRRAYRPWAQNRIVLATSTNKAPEAPVFRKVSPCSTVVRAVKTFVGIRSIFNPNGDGESRAQIHHCWRRILGVCRNSCCGGHASSAACRTERTGWQVPGREVSCWQGPSGQSSRRCRQVLKVSNIDPARDI